MGQALSGAWLAFLTLLMPVPPPSPIQCHAHSLASDAKYCCCHTACLSAAFQDVTVQQVHRPLPKRRCHPHPKRVQVYCLGWNLHQEIQHQRGPSKYALGCWKETVLLCAGCLTAHIQRRCHFTLQPLIGWGRHFRSPIGWDASSPAVRIQLSISASVGRRGVLAVQVRGYLKFRWGVLKV